MSDEAKIKAIEERTCNCLSSGSDLLRVLALAPAKDSWGFENKEWKDYQQIENGLTYKGIGQPGKVDMYLEALHQLGLLDAYDIYRHPLDIDTIEKLLKNTEFSQIVRQFIRPEMLIERGEIPQKIRPDANVLMPAKNLVLYDFLFEGIRIDHTQEVLETIISRGFHAYQILPRELIRF